MLTPYNYTSQTTIHYVTIVKYHENPTTISHQKPTKVNIVESRQLPFLLLLCTIHPFFFPLVLGLLTQAIWA